MMGMEGWMVLLLCLAALTGWIATTWIRVRNGYPLENSWGKAVYPKTDAQAKERVALLTRENAELRAEIGSVKDRLVNVERIVTDSGYSVGAQIEQLRVASSRDDSAA